MLFSNFICYSAIHFSRTQCISKQVRVRHRVHLVLICIRRESILLQTFKWLQFNQVMINFNRTRHSSLHYNHRWINRCSYLLLFARTCPKSNLSLVLSFSFSQLWCSWDSIKWTKTWITILDWRIRIVFLQSKISLDWSGYQDVLTLR